MSETYCTVADHRRTTLIIKFSTLDLSYTLLFIIIYRYVCATERSGEVKQCTGLTVIEELNCTILGKGSVHVVL